MRQAIHLAGHELALARTAVARLATVGKAHAAFEQCRQQQLRSIDADGAIEIVDADLKNRHRHARTQATPPKPVWRAADQIRRADAARAKKTFIWRRLGPGAMTSNCVAAFIRIRARALGRS